MESQDSEQFFRRVLGVSDGSTLEGMKPILEGSKGELNRNSLQQRPLLSGVHSNGIQYYTTMMTATYPENLYKMYLFD